MSIMRPQESDYNPNARRAFRPFPNVKRAKSLRGNGNGHNQAKVTPPEATNAENFYYLKQMSSRTPMVFVLTDGEQIHGWIEWYDRTCLKVNRDGAPNLLIQKHCIKYLFKEDEVAPG